MDVSVRRAAEGLASAAGGFTITGDGGRALLRALDDLEDKLTVALGQAETLGRSPRLGTTPAALVYRPFLATIATDDGQGLVPTVHHLLASVARARAAITDALAAYRDGEGSAHAAITGQTW
ncbi:MAG: hypothetical protein HOV94_25385 [Saccharothrix sp.]|nr:hypothetical protein [Saccharothrix sp.]